jgi:hypothetical protein
MATCGGMSGSTSVRLLQGHPPGTEAGPALFKGGIQSAPSPRGNLLSASQEESAEPSKARGRTWASPNSELLVASSRSLLFLYGLLEQFPILILAFTGQSFEDLEVLLAFLFIAQPSI